MRDMRDQPAGWYRDSERPNLHRYWSGDRWSETFGEDLVAQRRARVPEQRHEGHQGQERWVAQVASDAVV